MSNTMRHAGIGSGRVAARVAKKHEESEKKDFDTRMNEVSNIEQVFFKHMLNSINTRRSSKDALWEVGLDERKPTKNGG